MSWTLYGNKPLKFQEADTTPLRQLTLLALRSTLGRRARALATVEGNKKIVDVLCGVAAMLRRTRRKEKSIWPLT
jgi:hypothetical protein